MCRVHARRPRPAHDRLRQRGHPWHCTGGASLLAVGCGLLGVVALRVLVGPAPLVPAHVLHTSNTPSSRRLSANRPSHHPSLFCQAQRTHKASNTCNIYAAVIGAVPGPAMHRANSSHLQVEARLPAQHLLRQLGACPHSLSITLAAVHNLQAGGKSMLWLYLSDQAVTQQPGMCVCCAAGKTHGHCRGPPL